MPVFWLATRPSGEGVARAAWVMRARRVARRVVAHRHRAGCTENLYVRSSGVDISTRATADPLENTANRVGARVAEARKQLSVERSILTPTIPLLQKVFMS